MKIVFNKPKKENEIINKWITKIKSVKDGYVNQTKERIDCSLFIQNCMAIYMKKIRINYRK